MPLNRAFIALLVATVGACAPAAVNEATHAPPADFVACTTPRPEICTRDYRPVCAQVDTGKRCVTTPCESNTWATRGNACSACSDQQVAGFRPGECAAAPR